MGDCSVRDIGMQLYIRATAGESFTDPMVFDDPIQPNGYHPIGVYIAMDVDDDAYTRHQLRRPFLVQPGKVASVGVFQGSGISVYVCQVV